MSVENNLTFYRVRHFKGILNDNLRTKIIPITSQNQNGKMA